jgi:lariat debranching enzyme
VRFNPNVFAPVQEIGDVACTPIHEYKSNSSNNNNKNGEVVRIAVEGCCHGELDAVYDNLLHHEQITGHKIDLLLQCGDFQSLRNGSDYHSCSIPPKFRTPGPPSFARYYSGEKVAPILTIFVGGNHEASQPLRELYYGGWVAPNIYYLGAVGVVNYRGIRIGGISGIYNSHHYEWGHHETAPYESRAVKSLYHVRKIDVERAKLLAETDKGLDVFVSHDWPLGIEQHGNTKDLIRRKPYFKAEIQRNDLGSPPNREILDALKPRHWFSAHLHVKFHARMVHPQPAVKQEKDNDDDDNNSNGDESVAELSEQVTEFLALDKVLPRRHFLSVLNLRRPAATSTTEKEGEEGESNNSNNTMQHHLEYDPEWLAILKNTHHWTRTGREPPPIKGEAETSQQQYDAAWVRQRFRDQTETPEIPKNFVPTVPGHTDGSPSRSPPPLPAMGNPQTDRLLELLQLDHTITVPYDPDLTPSRLSALLQGDEPLSRYSGSGAGSRTRSTSGQPRSFAGRRNKNENDENEIDIDSDSDDEEDQAKTVVVDENEIEIDIDGSDGDGDESGDTAGNGEAATTADSNEIDIDDEGSDQDSAAKVVVKKARVET